MRQAWVLVTCALMLMACSRETSFKVDPAQRPTQAGTGEWVARVLVFSGQVGIQAANGFNFDAMPELPLLRSDRLTVGDQSFAIVHLKSERLTRLEANQSMQVADLAGLDAPIASQPIEQQLTGLLRADETADSSRIVGWHARMAAARTVPVQDQYKHKSEVKSFERPQAQAMAGKDSAANSKAMRSFGPSRPKPVVAPAAPPSPPAVALAPAFKTRPAKASRIKPKPQVKRRSPKLSRPRSAPIPVNKEVADLDDLLADDKGTPPRQGLGESGGDAMAGLGFGSTHGKGGSAKKPAKDARKSAEEVAARPAFKLRIGAWFAWTGGKWSKGKAPRAIRDLVRSDRLKRCFEVLLEKNPESKQAKIILRVKDGKIISVQLTGGGGPAACLRGRLEGKKLLLGLSDGRYLLEVRLR
jgi:hypothetical protein